MRLALGRLTRFAVAAIVALGALGCGDDETTTSPPRPAETIDPVPALPPGWTVEINREQGFAFGLPPGWEARSPAGATLLTAPGRRVSVSIVADRTDEALTMPLERYATEVMESVGGFERVRVGTPRPFRASYDALSVEGIGMATAARPGQRLLLIVLRRDRLATYAVLSARRASVSPRLYRTEVNRLARSLRGRPVEVPG